MKNLSHIIILLLLTYATTSCMQNGGNIGHLYGQWRLEKIVDDTDTLQCDTVFLSFQADIFQLRKIIYESYDYTAFIGLFEHQEEHLKLNFLNHNSQDVTTEEQTAKMLKDLSSLYIYEVSPLFFVEQLDRNNMILDYNNRRYFLKKLN